MPSTKMLAALLHETAKARLEPGTWAHIDVALDAFIAERRQPGSAEGAKIKLKLALAERRLSVRSNPEMGTEPASPHTLELVVVVLHDLGLPVPSTLELDSSQRPPERP